MTRGEDQHSAREFQRIARRGGPVGAAPEILALRTTRAAPPPTAAPWE